MIFAGYIAIFSSAPRASRSLFPLPRPWLARTTPRASAPAAFGFQTPPPSPAVNRCLSPPPTPLPCVASSPAALSLSFGARSSRTPWLPDSPHGQILPATSTTASWNSLVHICMTTLPHSVGTCGSAPSGPPRIMSPPFSGIAKAP